ncbi:transporter substrate-binding domain-containing protein [Intrasporangium sp.]|uniref:transporter substrate-binding domain-containing protein n=1 Tax=Intrasporangium sp. TaxID=1925024 RepID=UPI00293B541A|nr:transporter substrate-binding domain-containing protein [Intrasporangium sp.]MDV3223114.1 transporter substrate-binding domain-containing protein [Intrasporangium sp.]
MRPKAISSVAVLASVAGLVLAACGSESEPEGQPQESQSGQSAPLYSELPEAIRSQGYLTLAGDSHPPYRTVQDDKKVTGIDPDFQKLLEGQLGVELRTEITSGLPAILQGMMSGRYDAFNGPVRSTEEREQDFDSIVWMTTRSSYVFPVKNSKGIESSEDLCGLRVAGTEGSVTETQVQRLNEWCSTEGKTPNEFIGLQDTNATVLAVQSDRADVLATTQSAAIDLVDQRSGEFDYVTQTDEQGAGVDLMAMLTPKSTKLGPVLFKATENLFGNGQYEAFMKQWGLEDVAIAEPLFNPATQGSTSTPADFAEDK